MLLQPREIDRLLLFQAAELARARRARGLLLNAPEAIALIADAVCEAARDGADHAGALAAGAGAVPRDAVLPDVPSLIGHVEVEALFADGSRLVVVPQPLGPPDADGPGSVVAAPVAEARPEGLVEIAVVNRAAVPIAVTSHWHFLEANRLLEFDRAAAYGMRLAIPTGSTVRWAPGETRTVALRPFAGARVAYGFSGLVNGPLDAPGARDAALALAAERGYLGAA